MLLLMVRILIKGNNEGFGTAYKNAEISNGNTKLEILLKQKGH